MPSQTNITQIPAPRVPIIDAKTGLLSREWFRFFNNMFTILGSGASDDPLYEVKVAPIYGDTLSAYQAETTKDVDALFAAPAQEYGELAKLLDAVADPPFNTAEIDKYLQALDVAPAAATPQARRKTMGSFRDTTTQTAAAINTAYAITFNTSDLSSGVVIGSPTSRITVDRGSVYKAQFALQLNKTTAVAKNVWFWLRVNGVDITASAHQMTLAGGGVLTMAVGSYLLTMNANDYLELVWSTDDTACQVVSIAAAAPVPLAPSAQLIVTDTAFV